MCNNSSNQLPDRVLDLGDPGKPEDSDVRLCESRGKTAAHICLSHCWGKSQHITTSWARCLHANQRCLRSTKTHVTLAVTFSPDSSTGFFTRADECYKAQAFAVEDLDGKKHQFFVRRHSTQAGSGLLRIAHASHQKSSTFNEGRKTPLSLARDPKSTSFVDCWPELVQRHKLIQYCLRCCS
jgi:hypothetical protein